MIKEITCLALFSILGGCSNKNSSIQTNSIPPKKTFVKKESSTAPSNRNNYYPPIQMGGYYQPNMGGGGYPPPINQYSNGLDYYIDPLGNGPISYQNSPEDIENQRQGRD